MKRKVVQQGPSTLMVSLPAKWAKRLGIKKGDEINIDYSTVFLKGWEMKCTCGSKNCRKVIHTFDKLPLTVQERLKKYVTSYVRKNFVKSIR